MAMPTAAETGLAVAAAVTVAMAVADKNRNCRGRQQQQKNVAGGRRSGRYRGCGSSNRCSMAAKAGRGSGAAEVTTIRAAATATTVVINLYPSFPLAMVTGHRERR
jgi:hypothetical protein